MLVLHHQLMANEVKKEREIDRERGKKERDRGKKEIEERKRERAEIHCIPSRSLEIDPHRIHPTDGN